jgi:hypothetical protein
VDYHDGLIELQVTDANGVVSTVHVPDVSLRVDAQGGVIGQRPDSFHVRTGEWLSAPADRIDERGRLIPEGLTGKEPMLGGERRLAPEPAEPEPVGHSALQPVGRNGGTD